MNLSQFKNSLKLNVKKQKQAIDSEQQLTQSKAKKSNDRKQTFGQKLADGMVAKVGSWAFLISQTSVLALWVGVKEKIINFTTIIFSYKFIISYT